MAEPTSNRWGSARFWARPGQEGLVHRTDLVVSLVVLAICAFFYYVTTTFDEVSTLLSQNIPPEFFPRGVLIIIMIMALGLPFEHVLHRRRGEDIDSERSERVKRMPYLTTGLLFLIILAMPYVGTLICMIAICLTLPVLWGERRWRRIILFALLFPLAVAYVFDRVLLVQFEPGMLGIAP
ncbi:MAG: tripartite tricarboxylate transporter TctB family protein [Hyphomicrobiales bacterium]|nr:tripartite tricarboxylate transporter TctB family protein [Hyphomicrobiales bacterium]